MIGYLAAVQDPARAALVAKLAVVMGADEAEKTVSNLEATVFAKAKKGAGEGARDIIIPALWGIGAMTAVQIALRFLK